MLSDTEVESGPGSIKDPMTPKKGPSSKRGENVGRWTKEEHELFLKGLRVFGKEWKKIATMIPTRTVVQIRTHAQKYFQKLAKQEGQRSSGMRGSASRKGPVKRRASSDAGLPGGAAAAAAAARDSRPTTPSRARGLSLGLATSEEETAEEDMDELPPARQPPPPPPLPQSSPVGVFEASAATDSRFAASPAPSARSRSSSVASSPRGRRGSGASLGSLLAPTMGSGGGKVGSVACAGGGYLRRGSGARAPPTTPSALQAPVRLPARSSAFPGAPGVGPMRSLLPAASAFLWSVPVTPALRAGGVQEESESETETSLLESWLCGLDDGRSLDALDLGEQAAAHGAAGPASWAAWCDGGAGIGGAAPSGGAGGVSSCCVSEDEDEAEAEEAEEAEDDEFDAGPEAGPRGTLLNVGSTLDRGLWNPPAKRRRRSSTCSSLGSLAGAFEQDLALERCLAADDEEEDEVDDREGSLGCGDVEEAGAGVGCMGADLEEAAVRASFAARWGPHGQVAPWGHSNARRQLVAGSCLYGV